MRTPLTLVLILATALASAAEGPGLGNLNYAAAEVDRPIARFVSPFNHGLVAMVKGFLFVGQGGPGGGQISFFDVANPRAPRLVGATASATIGELHSFGQVGDFLAVAVEGGVDIYNIADPTSPKLHGRLVDAGSTDEWLCWQWPFIYQTLGNGGMNVIDASDPARPVLVRRLSRTQTGGFNAGTVDAIGNLMTITFKRNGGSGVATFDLSDPANPTLLDSLIDGAPTYSTAVADNRLFGFGNDGFFYVFDINDPRDIKRIHKSVQVGDKGGYGVYHDDIVHGGFTNFLVRFDARANAARSIPKATFDGGIAGDWDFMTAVGNLTFCGNDDGGGSTWIPSQTAPDTTPPRVTMVQPRANATGVAVTSCVGVVLSDRADDRSVKPTSFFVRKVGGSALPGRISFSVQNTLSLTPDQRLDPATTYEVVLPANGVKDQSGNAITAQFISRFTTAGGALPPPAPNQAPSVALTSPTAGQSFTAPATIAMAATASDSDGTIARIEFLRGGAVVGTDTSAPFTFSLANVAAGSVALAARATDNAGATTTSATVTVTINAPTPGNQAPTVALTSPSSGQSFAAPATIGLAATASDSDGTIARVEFLRGGVVVGTDTSAPFTFSLANVAAGSVALAARATDNIGAVTTSAAVTVTVNAAGGNNAAPTVAITAPADGATVAQGSALTARGSVADADGGTLTVRWFIDRRGDGKQAALLLETTQAPGAITVTRTMSGTIISTANEAVSLGDVGADYTLRLEASDGVHALATVERTFRLGAAGAATALTVTVPRPTPALIGRSVAFGTGIVVAGALGTPRFAWSFGDGTADTALATSANASHVFARAGHFLVVLRVQDDRGAGTQVTTSFIQTIHHPLTAVAPTNASSIALDAARGRVWAVNSDAGTVAAVDVATRGKRFEVATGRDPRTVAVAPDGTIWVTNRGVATISVVDGATGSKLTDIGLPRGSAPHGVAFAPDGSAAYVTLEATGRLLRLSPSTRAVTATLDLGPTVRGIAIAADSRRVLVTRFVSPADRGEVYDVDGPAMLLVRTIALAIDPGLGGANPDDEEAGRGVPNYLAGITISPDGRRAWVPCKKDNIQRGTARDGRSLGHDSTVRALVAPIDLAANAEVIAERIDLNDSEQPTAVAFTPLGDHLLVALQGNNLVMPFDAATGGPESTSGLGPAGLAPRGLVFAANGTRLFVHNFMSRDLAVWDTTGFADSSDLAQKALGSVATQASEPLSAQVLTGKRIFYNAADRRMSLEGYLSCASCHVEGGHDGRVWDFTQRGEGLRNTTDLRGRRGSGHGRVHWSANFDEIQDFEHDIRAGFGGLGFMSDAAFNTGTRNTTLGDRKAGQSADLDALAAYVTSLSAVADSPTRNADGTLGSAGVRGRAVFARLNCQTCHAGNDFTDSASNQLHDVGTIKATSGRRLGAALTGIDTPTLRGLSDGAPFLHDGSAATLAAVFDQGTAGSAHGLVRALSSGERGDLLAFLQQIDGGEPAVPANQGGGAPVLSGQDIGAVGAAGSTAIAGEVVTIRASGVDIFGNRDEFHFAHQTMTGDGEIIAQVTGLVDTNEWAKAGVMIRDGLAADARHAMTVVTPRNGVAFQRRTAIAGASSHTAGSRTAAPRFVRLVRSGSTLTSFEGSDGVTWTQVGAVIIALPATIRVGLCVSSHNDGTLTTATFTNVRIIPVVPGVN